MAAGAASEALGVGGVAAFAVAGFAAVLDDLRWFPARTLHLGCCH